MSKRVYLEEFETSVLVKNSDTLIMAIEQDLYRECLDDNTTPRGFWEFKNEYDYMVFKRTNKARFKKFYINQD